MNIRPTVSADIPDLERVLSETGLFPSDMLREMISAFLSAQESSDIWMTCEVEGRAIGFCYAAPEALTKGTWNMLAIAVLPGEQGRGVGGAIVSALEDALKERDARVLIADTSGTAAFERTRAFYSRNGYTEEARIRDFWTVGDDKVVFWKAL